MNHQCIGNIFEDGIGLPIFCAPMTRKRFEVLHANITFDDAVSRPERFQHDIFSYHSYCQMLVAGLMNHVDAAAAIS